MYISSEHLSKESIRRIGADTSAFISLWRKHGRRFNKQDHALVTQCLYNQVFMLNLLAERSVIPLPGVEEQGK